MSRNESLVSEILSVKWREVRYKVNIVFQFLAATTCDSPDPMTSLYPLCSWGAKLWYCLAHDHWSWTARCKLMAIKFAPSLQHSQWDKPDKHEIDTCERDKNIGLLLTSKFIQSSLDYGSFFREFSPETQHCYAQNLGIDYSGWTDLINGGIFFSSVLRGGSRIFSRRGCTRLLLYFNTNKPHRFFFFFFFRNTSCIRKPQVISGGGGVCTPCTLPLDPPLVLVPSE